MSRTRFVTRFLRTLFTSAWQSVVTWVVILTAIGAVVALVASQFATIDALRTRNFQLGQSASQAAARYDRLFDEYSKLYDESEQQGVTPSTTEPSDVPSSATTGTRGATGAAGVQGPVGPRGQDGKDGADGRDGKTGAAGDPGSAGAPGASGLDGQDGTAGSDGATGLTGPQGATGATGSAGQDGATGAAGKDGKDGRGVASVTCNDDGTWTITYTDDTTSTATGPCRVLPAPTETPVP